MRQGLVALSIALVVLLALDLGLRSVGALPPDDPLLFFVRTREPRVDPFVAVGEGRIAIRDDWVNDGQGLRGRSGKRAGRQFLLPGFRPASLAVPKPPDTLRVLALGGSTTYGLYVGADEAFPARLGRALRARARGRAVEVVNLGCPGFASDRVTALLRSVLRLEPDLVIVLTGHNEMLGGEIGPAASLTPGQRLRARLLRTSSLFAWWNHLLARTLRAAETEQVREEVAALEAGQIPTYVPEAVPETRRAAPSDAFRARAADRYAQNLAAMVAATREAGVPLLVALPAANLRAEVGFPVPLEDEERRRRFDEVLRAARARLAAGRAESALVSVDEALALAPDHAVAWALRGDVLLGLGRTEDALEAYRAALERDGRTHRITGSAIEAALATLSGADAEWIDLRPVFHAHLDREAAAALFIDHVHPTAAGHAKIAEALLPAATRRLGL